MAERHSSNQGRYEVRKVMRVHPNIVARTQLARSHSFLIERSKSISHRARFSTRVMERMHGVRARAVVRSLGAVLGRSEAGGVAGVSLVTPVGTQEGRG